MKNSRLSNVVSTVFIVLVFAFMYIPILSMIIFSFNSSRSLTTWTGFSFEWYQTLFTDPEIIEVVLVSIIVAVVSTVISTIIGTLAAIMLTKQSKKWRNITLQVNNIPIMNPEIVTAISLFLLFGAFMIPRGYATLLLAHITFSIPYVVVAVFPRVSALDPNLVQAAYDLGATPTKALFKVILPQIKYAMIAGASIAFTMSFDDFSISYFAVQGTSIKNISIYLYTLKRGVPPTVNALSTIIVFFIASKVIFDVVRNKRKNKKMEDIE